ncbi:MAG: sarcosine oxidase subunit alpha family protein [Pseudomonadota bacterium]
MSGDFRIKGGLVDRGAPIRFQWNDRWMQGFAGDTLASALLANGQKVVGRSFKYHRPRGVFSAGSEEPNALVHLGKGARQEPNTRATTVELYPDLYATSQNHRGSLHWDLMSFNDLLWPFLGAGFYYKTFMWPAKFWERIYEPIIRASAGLGALSEREDPDTYDRGYLHCDVLVIGAGPAGLAAALAAGRSGARVLIADEDFLPGGRLNAETYEVDGKPGSVWAEAAVSELAAMDNVRVFSRTTVYGAFDHGVYGALERKTDHLAPRSDRPRQVLWRIYAKRAILASGATERSIAFADNDRPGILQAGAVRAYANRFGVAAGKRVAILTNNDSGWRTAQDLTALGIEVSAIMDTRDQVDQSFEGVRAITGARVTGTGGRHGLRSVQLNGATKIDADCLAVSGGWSPNLQLTCHHRGKPVWNNEAAAFLPGHDLPPGLRVAGSAAGTFSLGAVLADGHAAGRETAADLGFDKAAGSSPTAPNEDAAMSSFWQMDAGRSRAWVDLQNDVTTKDIKQAQQEGFRSVEHVKRYTTLGMATDQGKTANVLGLGVMADITGKPMSEAGTTVFRPPYSPVAIGAFAGRSRGADFRPVRKTPSHAWAEENGAVFVEAGLWLRAQWYARPGEKGWRDSVDREVEMTRRGVGICDVTTLGKIDIQGNDAAEFLNRVYANPFLKLPVGKVRYGLMLREDGFVYDDGTTARLTETHFVMTTTTANAALVLQNLEFARQCLWLDLDVHLISITDGWAQYAVAGPQSRALLEKVVDHLDLSNEAFPFMACAPCTVFGGTPARLFRISFSGELAYEIAVPACYGDSMIRALFSVGEAFDAVPYGTEALGVMRVEKGHAAGAELNGQTTARMLGLGGMVSLKKDAIGTALSQRPAMSAEDGPRLVGLHPVDRTATLAAGAHFLDQGAPADMAHDLGWMTSVAYSPTLGHSIGLGFVENGPERMGDVIRAYDPVRGADTPVRIVSPHHIDPEGSRQRG